MNFVRKKSFKDGGLARGSTFKDIRKRAAQKSSSKSLLNRIGIKPDDKIESSSLSS